MQLRRKNYREKFFALSQDGESNSFYPMVGTWGQKSEEPFIHTPSVVGSSYCSCFGETIVPGSFSNAKLPALNIRTITLSPVQSWAGLCAYSITVLAGGMNWKLEQECSPAGDLQSRGFAWSHDECHRFFPCSFPWKTESVVSFTK